jgi:hypothetical protein
MKKSPFTRIAMATVATGFATIAFAAPANANMALDPEVGNVVQVETTPGTPAEPGTDWGQLAVAAAAGVALAGAGAAAVAGTRRRHLAHPV